MAKKNKKTTEAKKDGLPVTVPEWYGILQGIKPDKKGRYIIFKS